MILHDKNDMAAMRRFFFMPDFGACLLQCTTSCGIAQQLACLRGISILRWRGMKLASGSASPVEFWRSHFLRKTGLHFSGKCSVIAARFITPIHPSMSVSVSVQYAARVAAGKIERDDAQEVIVGKLARLEKRLAEHRLARKSSSLG